MRASPNFKAVEVDVAIAFFITLVVLYVHLAVTARLSACKESQMLSNCRSARMPSASCSLVTILTKLWHEEKAGFSCLWRMISLVKLTHLSFVFGAPGRPRLIEWTMPCTVDAIDGTGLRADGEEFYSNLAQQVWLFDRVLWISRPRT